MAYKGKVGSKPNTSKVGARKRYRMTGSAGGARSMRKGKRGC